VPGRPGAASQFRGEVTEPLPDPRHAGLRLKVRDEPGLRS
jgi:hypothetical protein